MTIQTNVYPDEVFCGIMDDPKIFGDILFYFTMTGDEDYVNDDEGEVLDFVTAALEHIDGADRDEILILLSRMGAAAEALKIEEMASDPES